MSRSQFISSSVSVRQQVGPPWFASFPSFLRDWFERAPELCWALSNQHLVGDIEFQTYEWKADIVAVQQRSFEPLTMSWRLACEQS